MSVTLFVNFKEENEAQNTITKAYSQNDGFIGITADSLEEALKLLPQGEKEARAKMNAWDGYEEDPGQIEADPGRYVSEKDPLRTTAYIKNAVEYCQKRGFANLRCIEFYRMVEYARDEIWRGLYGAYCLGYKRGREKGRKERKAK